MGNCQCKSRNGDVITAPQLVDKNPVEKGAFRFDKDARQIVYVGEDAATAEITAIGSSQSGEDATNEGHSDSSAATENTNPALDAVPEKSLLGEITDFLEHDGDNSTVYTQASRGRHSPSLLFNSPKYSSQREALKNRNDSIENRDVGFEDSPRNNDNAVSPLGLEQYHNDGDSISRHPYMTIHQTTSEDGTQFTDSSTLNGLRHVRSEETYETYRDQVEGIEQSILLLKFFKSIAIDLCFLIHI